MKDPLNPENAKQVALDIVADIDTGHVLRRKYSQKLRAAGEDFFLELARELFKTHGERWLACELLRHHEGEESGLPLIYSIDMILVCDTVSL